MYPEAEQVQAIIAAASTIVIIQADNPDADSLGSALALEHILGDLGKEPYLYCGVDMPAYLHYMEGWDRVSNELPSQFDASIIVDASTMTLLEKLVQSGYQSWLSTKPCVVLDHHKVVEHPIPFSTVTINDHTRASAGELLFLLSKQLEWKLSQEAQTFIMSSILGDTQGLSNQLATAQTYHVMAEMVENGIDRPSLEETRRQYSKMVPEIYKYKGELLQRTKFEADGRIAWVAIPQIEISTFSPLYNPGPLVQGDMLQTTGVQLAIVFKYYNDGKVTGAIRCNPDAPIGADLADHLGGGGHAFASGFKVTDGRSFDEIRNDCLAFAIELLNKNNQD